jgi:hypothetical protein
MAVSSLAWLQRPAVDLRVGRAFVRPLNDGLAAKVLQDVRTAAMRKLQRSVERVVESP